MNEQPASIVVATSKRLSKAEILAADDRRTIEVDVPAWGGLVRVRELSATGRNELSKVFSDNKDKTPSEQGQHVADQIFIASVIDETGAPMFTMADLPALREKSASALDVVTRAALELNGMKAGATTEKEKN